MIVLRGSFTRSDERTYTHVPFDVPPRVGGLHISYQYSDQIASDPRLRDGNTLDIGLFDPRGIAESSPGFRGWSGSHKQEFTLTRDWATPPYIKGEILPGTWHVLLGPYKVGPRGCDYKVTITMTNDEVEPPFTEPRSVTAERPTLTDADPEWLRGDLHCHTLYSDGDSWPVDMLDEAIRRGLDFLGVTDHNQTSHHAAYALATSPNLPIVLPGIEVTTYAGHWNAWGTSTWWDFREPTEAATTRAMQAAANAGAVVSVNHPKPFGPPWEYPNVTGFHAIEVWNGGWHEHNAVSLEWWDTLLRQGRRIAAVGGSDTHHLKSASDPDHLGRPTTFVHAEANVQSILDALRTGASFISREPDGPQLYLSDDTLRVVGGRGATLTLITARGPQHQRTVASDDWTTAIQSDSVMDYLRAQLHKGDEILALSNPLWIVAQTSR